jgi:uncharacterized protein YggT (Ycf19 family)
MTYREEERVTHTEEEVAPAHGHAVATREVSYRSSPGAMVERVILLIFGIITGLIILRIILLLVAARQGNDLVSFIYNISEVFVAPFRDILRIDAVDAGLSELDVGALVALVGWAVIALLVFGILRIFRPSATA